MPKGALYITSALPKPEGRLATLPKGAKEDSEGPLAFAPSGRSALSLRRLRVPLAGENKVVPLRAALLFLAMSHFVGRDALWAFQTVMYVIYSETPYILPRRGPKGNCYAPLWGRMQSVVSPLVLPLAGRKADDAL